MSESSIILEQEEHEEQDQIITPWETSTKNGKFNYQKLVDQFGISIITQELIDRFEKVTGKSIHPWIKRGIFFAHRDLNEILNDYEQGKQIYLYSGRGPTSQTMHIGHIPSFMFMKWLQDVFNAIVIIQIADDEKVFFKNESFEKIYEFGFENAKDIIACGFDKNKTFIFSNRDYSRNQCFQTIVYNIMQHFSVNDVKAVFGIEPTMCLGAHMWPAFESAPAFSASFKDIFGETQVRCLVIYGCDQDPFFRMTRDCAVKMGYHKPCSLIMKFLPALEGKSKMNSTIDCNKPITTIFLDDEPSAIINKIKKYSFSGGKETLKEHREKGADLEVDVSYQMLKFFEMDDDKFEKIGNDYGTGKMLSSEIKKIISEKIIDLVENHKKNRATIDENDLAYFYDINKFKI